MKPSTETLLETLDMARTRATEMGYDQLVVIMKRSDDHGMSMSSMLTDGVYDTEVVMMAEVVKNSALRAYMGDIDEEEIPLS